MTTQTERLVEKIRAKTITPREFNHNNHIRLAAFAFWTHGFKDGLVYLNKVIQEVAGLFGSPQLFHATLTTGLYRLTIEALHNNQFTEISSDFESWVSNCEKLPNKKELLTYYSEWLLETDCAKTSYLLPDKRLFDSEPLYEPETYQVISGRLPFIISMPHNGTVIPESIKSKMTEQGRAVTDTDWYLRILYDFAVELGCWIIVPKYSRYLIDLNRDPAGTNLYPGANSTELCPTTTFAEEPIYQPGSEPTENEISQRIVEYWQPYHQKLTELAGCLADRYDHVVLFEAHSIASKVPRFFDGRLPDFNFGTNCGVTCREYLNRFIRSFDTGSFSKAINERFKGGYITRNYGRPKNGCSTIQLELSQATYMNEYKLGYDEIRANGARQVLRRLIKECIEIL